VVIRYYIYIYINIFVYLIKLKLKVCFVELLYILIHRGIYFFCYPYIWHQITGH
jgi:hypothetical protein